MLKLLDEQGAVPLDQLARFIGKPRARVEASLRGLQRFGLVEQRCFLVGDAPWCWLSRQGLSVAGGQHRYTVPNVKSLSHRRAINETRLFLSGRAPGGIWSSERTIHGAPGAVDHVPDASFEIDGERHAIEVELSRKSPSEITGILDRHSRRYDAVIYFCGPRTYSLMKRVQAGGRWPKLHVRRAPRSRSC